MILYKKTVAQGDGQRLDLVLEQLGAVSKPYFLCVLDHQDGIRKPNQPLTFFLEQHRDATEAIDATVSLATRLIGYPDLEQCLNCAKVIQSETQWAEGWDTIKGIITQQ